MLRRAIHMQNVLVAMMVSARMAVLALDHFHPALNRGLLSRTGVVFFLPYFVANMDADSYKTILS